MICKHCGSTSFVVKEGRVVCEYCGSFASNEDLEKMFQALNLVDSIFDDGYVSKEDSEKYNRLSKTPLGKLSDEELMWCYMQDKQNTKFAKRVWRSEIERRKLKLKLT